MDRRPWTIGLVLITDLFASIESKTMVYGPSSMVGNNKTAVSGRPSAVKKQSSQKRNNA